MLPLLLAFSKRSCLHKIRDAGIGMYVVFTNVIVTGASEELGSLLASYCYIVTYWIHWHCIQSSYFGI